MGSPLIMQQGQPDARETMRDGVAPPCGSLRDGVGIKSRPLSVRIANVHELRIEKETGCYLDYLYAICA